MRKTYKYQIEEEYKGEKIVVNVVEDYNNGILYHSSVEYPKDKLSRSLGSIPDSVILRKLEICEERICKASNTEHKDEKNCEASETGYYKSDKRLLKFIYNYSNCRYVLYLYINFVDRKVYFIDVNKKNVLAVSTLDNGEYRRVIRSDISKFEQFVDDYYDRLMIEFSYLHENLAYCI